METKKEEKLSPEREALEVRIKQADLDQKLHDLKTGSDDSIDQLLQVARCGIVDTEKTLPGSEPSYKSLWEDHELEEIKDLIMKKVRKL